MRKAANWMLFLLLCSAVGCGGGGGSASGGESPAPGPAPTDESRFATARVTVDVASGDVSIAPLSGDSRAIFAGDAIGITTTKLLEDSGENTRRIIRATIKNNLAETIGNSSGAEVAIRSVTPIAAPASDIRSSAKVTTLLTAVDGGPEEGPVGTTSFANPSSAWRDPADGALYILEFNKVKVLRNGRISIVRSLPAATNYHIVGTSQYLFVSQYEREVIWRIKKDGSGILAVAGAENDQGDINGASALSRINNPSGLDIMPNGDVIFADLGNRKVKLIQGAQGLNPTVSTVLSDVDASDVSVMNSAQFGGPAGGLVAVTDYVGNRVLLPSIPAGTLDILEGGAPSLVNGFFPAARLNTPFNLRALGRGFVIYEPNSPLRYIQCVDMANPYRPNSWHISSFAGGNATFGDGIGAAAGLGGNVPLQLCKGSDSEVLLGYPTFRMVRRVEPVGSGFPFYSGSGGSTSGTVSVGNAPLVRQFGSTATTTTPEYVYPTSFIQPGASVNVEWAFALSSGVTSFQFLVTVSGASNASGPLHAAAQVGSSQVMVRTLTGVVSQRVVVDGGLGQARLNRPGALAADQYGNIFFTDQRDAVGCVRVLTTAGQVRTLIGTKTVAAATASGTGATMALPSINGLWVAPDAQWMILASPSGLYQAKLNPVLGFTTPADAKYAEPANWIVNLILGDPLIAGTVNGVGVAARLTNPTSLVMDETQRKLTFVTNGHLIRTASYLGGSVDTPTSWQSASFTGAATSGSSDGAPNLARFNGITGLFLTKTGQLYVADGGNHLIRLVNPAGTVSTLAGFAASAGFVDSTGPSARLANPQGIVVDSFGYAYISESTRLRRLGLQNEMRTVVRNGTFADGLGTSGGFTALRGLVMTPSGDLVGADDGTLRIVQRVVTNN